MGPPAPKVAVSGYVEAFYQYNFNRPDNLTTAYRGFDNRSNSFTLHDAVIDVSAERGAVSARLALQVGHAPASYYSGEPNIPAQAGTGPSGPELWRIIQQAILGYRVPIGKGLLSEAGIFLSPIGIENLPIKDQWNWSRSNLFFALPYYHSGVRFTYPFTDRWKAVAYVVNGWNDIVNVNPFPCLMGILSYGVRDAFVVNALYFGGVERPTGAPEGQPWRNLFDLSATWTARKWLAFALELNAGLEPNRFGTSSWRGAAGYARVHALSPLWIAVRADFFRETVAQDAAGQAGRLFFPANDLGSQTLTAETRPAENFSLRLEYRHDGASAPMFFRGRVETVNASQILNARHQNTATLGALAWF